MGEILGFISSPIEVERSVWGIRDFVNRIRIMFQMFGGKDPFDDPFFTRPLGSSFGSTMFDASATSGVSSPVDKLKGLIIEELECDDGNIYDKEEMNGDGAKRDKYQENASANENPLVEHPEDETDDHDNIKSESTCKELSNRSVSSDRSKSEGAQPQKGGVSFQRVTYGGINGAYYTASTSRKTGKDGVMLEDSREADATTGQATHRISKGIHDKGHSVMRKLNSDGNVDTVRALHNLDEDELASFERSWKGNADTHIPGWDHGFNFPSTFDAGGSSLASWSGWESPFRNQFNRNAGFRPAPNARSQSNGGRPKKVVTNPIE